MDLIRTSSALTKDQKLAVVSVDEVKRAGRIDGADEDSLIADDIEAAYDFLSGPNGWLGRCCLLNEGWQVYAPSPLYGALELPLRPLVGSLTGFDMLAAGVYGPVASTLYGIAQDPEAFATVSRVGAGWPSVTPSNARAYRIGFSAGFGDTKAAIPSPIRKSIRMLALHWYQNREATGAEGRTVGGQVEFGLRALAGRYRIEPDHS